MDTIFKDFEVIIVDDGSTDDSYKVSKELAQKYPNVSVYKQGNKGVSAARNLGIDHAQGEYILFVDSDDTYVTNALCDIDKLVTDDQDLLMFGFKAGHFENKSWKKQTQPKRKTDVTIKGNKESVNWIFTTLVYKYPFFSACAKVFRKSVLDEYNVRFVEGISLGEDQIFTCDYLQHIGELRYLNVPYYNLISWPKSMRSFGLGSCRRTPDEFLLNQRANYDALMRLSKATGLDSVHEYAINYILDRPITRILFRSLDIRSHNKIGYCELKAVTKEKIKPVLQLEERNVSRVITKDISLYSTMILKDKPFWIIYCLIFLQQNIVNAIYPYLAAIWRRLRLS